MNEFRGRNLSTEGAIYKKSQTSRSHIQLHFVAGHGCHTKAADTGLSCAYCLCLGSGLFVVDNSTQSSRTKVYVGRSVRRKSPAPGSCWSICTI